MAKKGNPNFYKKSKYNNKRHWLLNGCISPQPTHKGQAAIVKKEMEAAGGVLCDSFKEAQRGFELYMMQKAGEISELSFHPTFKLEIDGRKIGKRGRRFTADFQYRNKNGELIVEDVKSPITKSAEAYTLRRDLFLALYPELNFVEL